MVSFTILKRSLNDPKPIFTILMISTIPEIPGKAPLVRKILFLKREKDELPV